MELDSLRHIPDPVPVFPVATWQHRDPHYAQLLAQGGFLFGGVQGFGWTPITEAICVAAINEHNKSVTALDEV